MRSFKTWLIILVFPLSAHAQLSVDAGKDSIYCHSDTVFLGGTPTASGGVAPYSYSWDVLPKPFTISGLPYFASDFLSDTTAPNPKIISFAGMNSFMTFTLTATDSVGSTGSDTITISESSWAIVPGQAQVNTFPGDTQEVNPGAFSGGFVPLVIDWGDSDSLLGPRYDSNYRYNYLPSRNVIIPQPAPGSNFKSYKMTVTDSIGCSIEIFSDQLFFIQNLGISSSIGKLIEVQIDHGQKFVSIWSKSIKISGISVFSNTGLKYQIAQNREHQKKITLRTDGLPPGIYFLMIQTGKGITSRKILLR